MSKDPLAYIGVLDRRGSVRTYVPIVQDVVFIGQYVSIAIEPKSDDFWLRAQFADLFRLFAFIRRQPSLIRIKHPDVSPIHLSISWKDSEGQIQVRKRRNRFVFKNFSKIAVF